MERKTKQVEKKASFEGINLVKRNGKTDNNNKTIPSIKPTNVEGHYPRFMLHGAVNLLEEDIRELSIILEIIIGTEIFRRLKGISQVELLPFAFKQVPWFTRYTHSCLTYVFGEYVIKKLQPKSKLSDI